MNPPFIHLTPETSTHHIHAIFGVFCSAPVCIDMPALEDSLARNTSLLTTWLSADERQHLQRFTFAKRRKEWLAGRICAKGAIDSYLLATGKKGRFPAWTEMTIANSGTGRPSIFFADGIHMPETPDLSISHSGDLALALAAETNCGVDIQKINRKLLRVQERFCMDQEKHRIAAHLQDHDPLMALTLAWTAKEAAKKALSVSRMPGFLDLILTDFAKTGTDTYLCHMLDTTHREGTSVEIKVVCACRHDYCLGICIL
jgi:phosphopantetheinyl transferase